MLEHPFAFLTASQWIDVGVAAGTGLLALATFALARQARRQASATVSMAEVAERQLRTSTTPVVRIMRLETVRQLDITTVNAARSDEALVVRFENRGPIPAELVDVTMAPGGPGSLADTGAPDQPVLAPGGEWDVDFHPGSAHKEHYQKGDEVLIQVVCEAAGTGRRYRMRTWIKRKGNREEERWLLLKERGPDLIGPA